MASITPDWDRSAPRPIANPDPGLCRMFPSAAHLACVCRVASAPLESAGKRTRSRVAARQ
jgi:hypothetical protein